MKQIQGPIIANKKPPQNAVVAKDNCLVSRLSSLTLQELRLLSYCLAHYDSRSKANPVVTATVSELASFYPSMDTKTAYEIIRETVRGIYSKPIEIETHGEYQFSTWLTSLRYYKGSGLFQFKINEEIKDYLIDLQGTFSMYRLMEVKNFRSKITWLLFENLNRWKNTRRWYVDLEELKTLLGVDGKYKAWIDFKKRCILGPLTEINKHTSLLIKYEPVRKMRKIVGVTFFIDKQVPRDTITLDDPTEELHKTLLHAGLNNTAAQQTVNLITRADKVAEYLKKVPKIIARHTPQKGPKARYVRGAINNDLKQLNLFEEPPSKQPDYQESLNCWQSKKQKGEECKVRLRGTPGQRQKCQICLAKIPVKDFGI